MLRVCVYSTKIICVQHWLINYSLRCFSKNWNESQITLGVFHSCLFRVEFALEVRSVLLDSLLTCCVGNEINVFMECTFSPKNYILLYIACQKRCCLAIEHLRFVGFCPNVLDKYIRISLSISFKVNYA